MPAIARRDILSDARLIPTTRRAPMAERFNLFLTQWNAQTAKTTKPNTFRRRKPISQAQRDAAEQAVIARRSRMTY